MFRSTVRGPLNAAAVLTAVALIGACGRAGSGTTTSAGTASAGTASAGTTSAPAATAAGQAAQTGGVTIADAWVKAAPSGMTAMFGMLTNTGSAPVTVTGAATDLAGMVELHETVTENGVSTMRQKTGGFVIPAGGTFELKPGGNHVMLMGLKKAVKAGEEVDVTLSLSNGSSLVVKALGKEFAGAKESYQPSMNPSMNPSMSGM